MKFALGAGVVAARPARVQGAVRHPLRRRLRVERERDHHGAARRAAQGRARRAAGRHRRRGRRPRDRRASGPAARFDADGRLLNGADAIGEIVGRNVVDRFEGYYRNPEAEAERTRNGWYWSGDLGYRDDDGVFYFAGRAGEWLRVDSENFATAPVERILARFPGASGVAVYPVPDERTADDQVMAAIELDAGTDVRPRRVRRVPRRPARPRHEVGAALRAGHDASRSAPPNKIDKRPLRAERWYTDDPVYWRPGAELALPPPRPPTTSPRSRPASASSGGADAIAPALTAAAPVASPHPHPLGRRPPLRAARSSTGSRRSRADYDLVVLAGDLLDISSIVEPDAQIAVVLEYLRRLAALTTVVVCSGNHDLERRERATASASPRWLDPAQATPACSSTARRSAPTASW